MRSMREKIKGIYKLLRNEGLVKLATQRTECTRKKNIGKPCAGKSHARFDEGEVRNHLPTLPIINGTYK